MPSDPNGRPRGRPKGSKNVPTPAAFVADTLSSPPVPTKPQKGPRKTTGGPWATMSPEERSAYGKRLSAARTAHRGGKPTGTPRSMTVAGYRASIEAARPIIRAVLRKMDKAGELPDDPDAVEALEVAMVALRTSQNERDRVAAARVVLDFTQPKPTVGVVEVVKSADDWLDQMAEEP